MNVTIIGGVAFIAAAAVLRALLTGTGVTRILVGAFLLLAVLSILEFFGGAGVQLADALVLIAVLVALLDIVPWAALLRAVGVA